MRLSSEAPFKDQFLIWSLGAMLFAHAATGISVSYFDQSVIFLYPTLATIGSFYAISLKEKSAVESAEVLQETENAADRRA